jgi:L-fuconolactonase
MDHTMTATPTPTVDAHHHLWDLKIRAQEWLRAPELKPIWRDFPLEELEPEARAVGVEKTVLVQVAASVEETREFLAFAACNKLIGGVVGWLALDGADPVAQLDAVRRGPGGQLLGASATWCRTSPIRSGWRGPRSAGA